MIAPLLWRVSGSYLWPPLARTELSNVWLLGAVHKWQYFHECTNHTLSETPSLPPPERVHINIFWVPKIPMKIIKIRPKSVWKKNLIFTDSPRNCMVCKLMKMLTFMDGPLFVCTTYIYIFASWHSTIEWTNNTFWGYKYVQPYVFHWA